MITIIIIIKANQYKTINKERNNQVNTLRQIECK